jgi:hypothetical protein
MIYASNMWYLLRKWKRKALEKNFPEDQPIPNLTQKELNQIYENPDIAISYKYSYIVKTFLMSAFYLPLFPLGTFISLIGITLMYLIEKYNLLNTYKRPEMLNSQICVFYITNFKFLIFTTALGNRIFLYNMWDINKFAIMSITIFSVLLIIPYHRLFKWKCLGVKESDILTKSYMDYYFDFATDYERQNPITKKKGNHTYLERLMEQGIITQEMYLDLSQKLENESVNMIELYYRRSANVQMKVKDSVAQMFRIRTMRTRGKTKVNLAQGLLKQAIGDLKTGDRVTGKKTRALENLVLSVLPPGFEFNNYKSNKSEKNKLDIEKNNLPIQTDQSEGKKKKMELFKKYKEKNQQEKNEQEKKELSNSENPFNYNSQDHTHSLEPILQEKENKNFLYNYKYPQVNNYASNEIYENTAFSGINLINNISHQVPKPQSENTVYDNQIQIHSPEAYVNHPENMVLQHEAGYSSPPNFYVKEGQENNIYYIPENNQSFQP